MCLSPLAFFPHRQEPCLTHSLGKGLAWWLMLGRVSLNVDPKNKRNLEVAENSLGTADILHTPQYHRHHCLNKKITSLLASTYSNIFQSTLRESREEA